jgi:uncharacterized protein YwqG
MRYLDEIAARQKKGKESETELLFELKEAFDEAAKRADGLLPEPMQTFYDLLRFSTCVNSIASFLRDEPQIIRQALVFAEKHHIGKLASILKDALDGKPQPKTSFFVTLPGQQEKPLEVEEPEVCCFDGKDWGSTDIAVSMALDDFEHALLQEILEKRETLDLQAPPLTNQSESDGKTDKNEAQLAISWEPAEEKRLSKIGGLPNIKQGFIWPQWKGVSLSFLAQLDLSELPSIPPSLAGLPQTGMLYFFYDKEQSTWGFSPEDRGSWGVLYESDATGLQEAVCPDDLTEEEVYSELPVMPFVVESFRGNETTRHQMGGFPNAVQSDDMEEECQLASNGINVGGFIKREDQARAESLLSAKGDWRLLFQLDSEEDAGMMWGDCGVLYFWIRTQDLSRRDFSKIWMVLQCC